MGWFGLFDDVADIAKEAIEDKDKRNEFNYKLSALREHVYIAELNNKTIPWVDALHKMGRQIISFVSVVGGLVVVAFVPDIDPLAVASVAAPGGIYNYVKGRGR